ncbi:MAG: cell division protein ZapA [Candidatus Binatia bacterium]
MQRPVEIEILGQKLVVTSDDNAEHVREMARYVDRRMRTLAAGGVSAASLPLALIAALNIESEYWKLQRQQKEMCETINRLTQRVSAQLGRLSRSVRKGEDVARR